jgi:hypothetical protein
MDVRDAIHLFSFVTDAIARRRRRDAVSCVVVIVGASEIGSMKVDVDSTVAVGGNGGAIPEGAFNCLIANNHELVVVVIVVRYVR